MHSYAHEVFTAHSDGPHATGAYSSKAVLNFPDVGPEAPGSKLLVKLDKLLGGGQARQTSSQYKGVSRDNAREKWVAQVEFQGKSFKLGRFTAEEEAARARDKAVVYLSIQ